MIYFKSDSYIKPAAYKADALVGFFKFIKLEFGNNCPIFNKLKTEIIDLSDIKSLKSEVELIQKQLFIKPFKKEKLLSIEEFKVELNYSSMINEKAKNMRDCFLSPSGDTVFVNLLRIIDTAIEIECGIEIKFLPINW